jgi:hypothetical protein
MGYVPRTRSVFNIKCGTYHSWRKGVQPKNITWLPVCCRVNLFFALRSGWTLTFPLSSVGCSTCECFRFVSLMRYGIWQLNNRRDMFEIFTAVISDCNLQSCDTFQSCRWVPTLRVVPEDGDIETVYVFQMLLPTYKTKQCHNPECHVINWLMLLCNDWVLRRGRNFTSDSRSCTHFIKPIIFTW